MTRRPLVAQGGPWALDDELAFPDGARGLPPSVTREPYAQRPPGWLLRTAEVDVLSGRETPIVTIEGAYPRIEVALSSSDDWSKANVELRIYQQQPTGWALVLAEQITALDCYQSSGRLQGRAASVASSGGAGWTVALYAPGSVGTLGRATITIAAAPTAGSSGQLAGRLGTPVGHVDRAEHIRGAALLGRRSDGRWEAIDLVEQPGGGPYQHAAAVASYADPAPDYEETSAPLIYEARAFRNASGVVATVTAYTRESPSVFRTFSNLQPGEVVPVRLTEIRSSTAWPIGLMKE